MATRIPPRRVLLHTPQPFLRWLREEDRLLVVLEAARWDGPDGAPVDWHAITTVELPVSGPELARIVEGQALALSIQAMPPNSVPDLRWEPAKPRRER